MPPAIPRATYRLQLSATFGFDDAAAVVPYLQALGISHLYASPFMKARAGSTHGYDITDHNVLNPEFGGEEGFARLFDALARADMGLILDFVPNHMGIGHADNSWWLDVLEWGAKSPYASVFDIDWSTLPYRPHGGLLLPILGKPYGDALEQGEIELRFDAVEGSFSFWYFDHRLPARPDRYSEIIRTIVAFVGGGGRAGQELLLIAEQYGKLRAPTRTQAPRLKSALAAVEGGDRIINEGLAAYAPAVGESTRVVALHRLLERQHYRLAHWRVAVSEINYRRFFDINDLAGIRVEDPRTFRLIHRKIGELIAAGKIHGLRLDHIDGLYDPTQYCARLQRFVHAARGDTVAKPFYTVVEKILAPDEPMPKFPGVAGTTGYDVLNLISRVLIAGDGLPVLEESWQTHAAPSRNFGQMVDEAKSRVIETTMASEFTVLSRLLARIAAGHWPSRDYTLDRLRAALELFVRSFPVYRTYDSGGVASDRDRSLIAESVETARERWYGSDIAVFDFLRDVLTLDLIAPGRTGYSAARVKRFVGKLQQFTGPVTAKAVEDTAFYRHHRLLALNEVGNDPSLPGLSVADFHKAMTLRAQQAPHAMTATATHDTKRGEDSRARIAALSEIARDWSEAVRRWTHLNAGLIATGKRRTPSRGHEYMLYQALVGAWSGREITTDFVERLSAYCIKAAREGKQETSWISPNEDYEAGLRRFVGRLLDNGESASFLDEFDRFAQRAMLLGALNGLSQLALKATVPGVPDFYQGTEVWDLSLVDPDNRRPVDFAARARLLAKAQTEHGVEVEDWRSGSLKFAVTHRLLQLRAELPDLFLYGDYEPIETFGPHRDHIIAFARALEGKAVIVTLGRQFAMFTDGGRHWPNCDAIDAGLVLDRYRIECDALNRRTVVADRLLPVSAVFAQVPVAVLQAAVSSANEMR
jgi:(1->4)-alpha-D-glucan 1-alpha-D-glucosylmutase